MEKLIGDFIFKYPPGGLEIIFHLLTRPNNVINHMRCEYRTIVDRAHVEVATKI